MQFWKKKKRKNTQKYEILKQKYLLLEKKLKTNFGYPENYAIIYFTFCAVMNLHKKSKYVSGISHFQGKIVQTIPEYYNVNSPHPKLAQGKFMIILVTSKTK